LAYLFIPVLPVILCDALTWLLCIEQWRDGDYSNLFYIADCRNIFGKLLYKKYWNAYCNTFYCYY